MDVSRYAANPEAYDALSAYQIAKFFKEHGLARDDVDHFAANLLGSPVSATLVQGATSYTVSGTEAAQVVQFRGSPLPMNLVELARQLYGDVVPECKSRGMFGPVNVYVADLVPGPAFCRVRRQFFSPVPRMEQRLRQTVQDFARSDAISVAVYAVRLIDEKNLYRFFALAWVNQRASTLEPPPGLLDEYFEILDKVSLDLPPSLQVKLDEVRRGLPELFRCSYPMVLQHDDLLVWIREFLISCLLLLERNRDLLK